MDDTPLTEGHIFPSQMMVGDHQPIFVLPRPEDKPYFAEWGGAPEAPLIIWAEQEFRGSVFVDIGAHVGTWSIPFALNGRRVYSFEAQPWLAKLCNAGFEINGLDNRCFPVALGCDQGVAFLQAPAADGGGGSIARPFASPAISLSTAIMPLDHFLLKPDLIKLDVEGAELRVLLGATQTIALHRPFILFECWEHNVEEVFCFFRDVLRYSVEKVAWPEMWLGSPL